MPRVSIEREMVAIAFRGESRELLLLFLALAVGLFEYPRVLSCPVLLVHGGKHSSASCDREARG